MIHPTERIGVLIVGAGQGGAQAAIQLRQQGYAGSIALMGAEIDLPYERPPLSKEYLKLGLENSPSLIRPASYWQKHGVETFLGQTVCTIDPSSKSVSTLDGSSVHYENLVWATGCNPRKLQCAGADLDNILTLRTRSDADRLLRALPGTRKVLVIGAGYIGLEAAAFFRTVDRQVTIIETASRVLSRVTGVAVSQFVAEEHSRQGVSLIFDCAVTAFEGQGGKVTKAVSSNGMSLDADLVMVGIGVEPMIEPLRAAGAECANGVIVDENCRTSLPAVYAIGDCAVHKSRYTGGNWTRIESIQNANDQAACAALSIIGRPEAYDALPWFWSNQYDLRIQSAGLAQQADTVTVRGDPGRPGFSVLYSRLNELLAIDAINAPRDYVQGRALITSRARVNLEIAPDPALALRDCVASG